MKTKDEAIDDVQVARNKYYQRALRFTRKWIVNRTNFTSEQVRLAFGEKTEEPRVWGAIFRTLHKEGVIAHAGWTVGTMAQCHKSPKRQWNFVPGYPTRKLF